MRFMRLERIEPDHETRLQYLPHADTPTYQRSNTFDVQQYINFARITDLKMRNGSVRQLKFEP